MKRQILCIDLRSFYASVECVMRKLDPFNVSLIVADKSRGKGSIVLAVSPYLKSLGFPSRCRLYEIGNLDSLIVAKPRMNLYIKYAVEVINIYLDFISEEDLFIYSIDEAFLDVTEYLNYYNKTAFELAQTILKEIKSRLGLYATCGIGYNMLVAKLALDLDAKACDGGIAKWEKEDIKTKLWPIKKLSKMWGIGSRMEKNLNYLGIDSIYDLAHFDVKVLKKHFGIIGIELFHHANGRDLSLIKQQSILKSINHSYSIGQVLFQDYSLDDARLIIKEMTDDLVRRLRLNKKKAQTLRISIGYSKTHGGGFSRQTKLLQKTNSPKEIFQTYNALLEKHYEHKPIRTIHLSLGSLKTEMPVQLDLFTDYQSEAIEQKLNQVVDLIKDKYGKNSVDYSTSLLEKSTKKFRNATVGGHSG